ncbi:hypothetical protein DUNSADRAFT_8130 [Dunaliella salina]|uniref:Uncharacterized protein n=1 Tax=Dunaliella salina TaxID=3046 RepID=A0ABQ7GK08_DUNSA|nr:hypothetical protein DUNSADRAFT_8130 [Dunaliella salina]|eukprot:KAF5834942.1 hypothetical protein DUNSADRAFT_8130 [Dunaliella salina]
MATVQNSFDLLEAASKAGSQPGSQGGGKKKNKNKANANANASAHAKADVEQHQLQQPVENGIHPSLGAQATSRKASAANESSLLAAMEAWERAARECKSMDSMNALWRGWIANAGEKSKAKYKGASGALMDFSTALLESRALELSIEGSVLAAGGVDAQLLSRLLSTFLSFEGSMDGPSSLATTLARLSSLLEGETPDTRGAGSRAVQAVIASLKAPRKAAQELTSSTATSSWINRISSIDKQIQQEQGDAVAGSRARGVGKGGQQSGSSALSAFKREEALLSQQAEQVASQIRNLEVQLRSLYSQQAELADKTAQLRQQQANTFDTVGSKNKGKGQAAGSGAGALGATHFQDELETIKALTEWTNPTQLQGPSSEQVSAMQASSAGVPLELMAAGQHYLGTALAALAEGLPHKVSFCRQRLAHAEKLVKLGAKDQEKTQRDAERLLEESLKGADDLLHGSEQVLADMNQRYQAILIHNPEHASTASAVLHSAEALASDIRLHHVQQQPPHQQQHQQQQQQQRNQGRGKGGNQQHQQQAAVLAVASSPRTPAGPPRQPPLTGVPSHVTPPAETQQGPAPVTPAPVPITAPVVPHDHMHAPPPSAPLFEPLAAVPIPAPVTTPSTPQPSMPTLTPEIVAANGGFEPAPEPVPAPAAGASRAAAAAAAAMRPASAPSAPSARWVIYEEEKHMHARRMTSCCDT